MNIAMLQRNLAALLRDEVVLDDRYLSEVAASTGFAVMRDVIVAWRDLLLRQGCPLTIALLKQRGRYTIDRGEAPAFAEELIAAFLDRFRDDRDPLVAAVAHMERALVDAQQGSDTDVAIDWPCDPDIVIARLRRGESVDDLEQGVYHMTVSVIDMKTQDPTYVSAP
jgi:hypothetical protein